MSRRYLTMSNYLICSSLSEVNRDKIAILRSILSLIVIVGGEKVSIAKVIDVERHQRSLRGLLAVE